MWLDKNMYRLLSADSEATQFTDMRQAATHYAFSHPMTFVKPDCFISQYRHAFLDLDALLSSTSAKVLQLCVLLESMNELNGFSLISFSSTDSIDEANVIIYAASGPTYVRTWL